MLKSCTRWQKTFSFGLLMLTAGVLLYSSGAAAAPPPGKGGGGGGNGGGGGLTNPAFVYRDTWDGGLFLLSSDGSVSERLTKPGSGAADNAANWSPDGERLAFFRQPDGGLTAADLYVIRADGSALTFLCSCDGSTAPVSADRRLAWTPDGTQLVYASFQSLWMVSLSDGALTHLVDVADGTRAPNFSPDLDLNIDGYQGFLTFHDEPGDKRQDIWQLEFDIDLDGNVVTGPMQIVTDPGFFQTNPRWSPDGRWLAFVEFDDNLNSGIVVMNTADGSVSPVVPTHTSTILTWSPDSQYIGFDNSIPGKGGSTWDIFVIRPDGTGLTNITATSSQRDRETWPDWNPAWIAP